VQRVAERAVSSIGQLIEFVIYNGLCRVADDGVVIRTG